MSFLRLVVDKIFRRKKLTKKNDASIYPMY
jgi:hypothetical protein